MKRKPTYCVYMLWLSNGHLYTGYTRDLRARLRRHGRGEGGSTTRSFRPLAIAQCWHTYGTRGSAMRVEAFIKGCSRKVKERLVSEPTLLPALLRRRRGSRIRLEPVAAEGHLLTSAGLPHRVSVTLPAAGAVGGTGREVEGQWRRSSASSGAHR